MSQGAEKCQPPEVGIEPGPQDLKANTLPHCCKSQLLPQGSSVIYLSLLQENNGNFTLTVSLSFSGPIIENITLIETILTLPEDYQLMGYAKTEKDKKMLEALTNYLPQNQDVKL